MNKLGTISLIAISLALILGTITLVNPTANFVTPIDAVSIQSEPIETQPEIDEDLTHGITFSGWVIIEVYDKDGNLKYYNEDHNLTVTKGVESAIDLLFGTTHTTGESVGGFSFLQLGIGTTNPAAGDTACENITGTGAKVDDTAVVNTSNGVILNLTSWTHSATITDGVSISEICLTDNGSPATGNLFARQEFTPFTFNTGDLVNATWTITGADDGV